MANATTPSATYKVRPRTPTVEPFGPVTKVEARGSCVLLHGWGSIGIDMGPLCAALRKLPSAAGWNFYNPTYETHQETFVQAAQHLYPDIHALTQPLILLGYSMGGIVARQMILDGLQIKALMTICSPHLGVGTWIPAVDAGVASISWFSADLKRLNDSPQERGHRHLYHLSAISCSDLWGDHSDDGVIPVQSALGISLGPVAEQVTIHLDYDDQIAGVDPHHRGMDPTYLQPVLNTCLQLFEVAAVV
jgi:pimeloyl-ACP methyl ester carboxylesterase